MTTGDAMVRRREMEKQLIKTFVELEGFDFATLSKVMFFEHSVYPKVMEIIKEHADSYVTLISMTNAGQTNRTLTLDFFEDREQPGDITFTFCMCGTNFSAVKKLLRKKEEIVLYSGECHTNELWKKHLGENND